MSHKLIHYHDGEMTFPHGAGPSERGWYVYEGMDDQEPSGPVNFWDIEGIADTGCSEPATNVTE